MVALFELPSTERDLREIVERNSFKSMSGGRDRGQQSASSFQRKGVAGDWENFFTPELREMYERVSGQLLAEHGYRSGVGG